MKKKKENTKQKRSFFSNDLKFDIENGRKTYKTNYYEKKQKPKRIHTCKLDNKNYYNNA